MGYSNYRRRKSNYINYDQNDGKPGVVYILINEAFQENYLKIGQTTRSGSHRAFDLNEQAGTGLPKKHVCAFEYRTVDCGRAEKLVHERLAQYRQGPQEYFFVEIELAKSVIVETCQLIDANARRVQAEAERERRRLDEAAARQAELEENQRVTERNANVAREAAEARAAALTAQMIARGRHQSDQVKKDQKESRWGQRTVAPIELFCPGCGAELNGTASAEEMEKKFRCKSCKTVFTWKRFPTPTGPRRESAQEGPSFRARSSTIDEKVASGGRPPTATNKGIPNWFIVALIFGSVVAFVNLTGRSASVKNVPAPTQQINTQAPVVPKDDEGEAKKRAQLALDSAMSDAIQQYPYLSTKAGEYAMSLIHTERADIEAHGATPAEALSRAVAAIAPRYAKPAPAKEKKSRPTKTVRIESTEIADPIVYDPPGGTSVTVPIPQPPSKVEPYVFDRGGYPGFPPGCRYVRPYEWSCK